MSIFCYCGDHRGAHVGEKSANVPYTQLLSADVPDDSETVTWNMLGRCVAAQCTSVANRQKGGQIDIAYEHIALCITASC